VVLVGDPQQLPATILSELAKQVGRGSICSPSCEWSTLFCVATAVCTAERGVTHLARWLTACPALPLCCAQVQMERSLFERLQQQGAPVKMLSVQYRMHPAIRQVKKSRAASAAGLDCIACQLHSCKACHFVCVQKCHISQFPLRCRLQFPSAHFYGGRLRDAESITAMPPAPFYTHPLMKASLVAGRCRQAAAAAAVAACSGCSSVPDRCACRADALH